MTQIHTGDPFPQFTFDTAYEESLDSRSILKGKTVFWVLRYIGCTVCRYDVHTIAQRYEEFTQKGRTVLQPGWKAIWNSFYPEKKRKMKAPGQFR